MGSQERRVHRITSQASKVHERIPWVYPDFFEVALKEYPKIEKTSEDLFGRSCIAFFKLDGSNLRYQWNDRQGWYKFGTRRRLFDESDPEYGCAVQIFLNKYADPLLQAVRNDRKAFGPVKELMAFAEFLGPNSFAGMHDPVMLGVSHNNPKDVILFDVNLHKKGFIGPKQFLESFGHLDIPKVVYQGIFDKDFYESVRRNDYGLDEGVIVKGGEGHKRWQCKIKTLAYLEKLKKRFGDRWVDFWE